jgi:hypothetical protein
MILSTLLNLSKMVTVVVIATATLFHLVKFLD